MSKRKISKMTLQFWLKKVGGVISFTGSKITFDWRQDQKSKFLALGHVKFSVLIRNLARDIKKTTVV